MFAPRIVSPLACVLLSLCAAAQAQIISGGGSGLSPPPQAGSDERIQVATRFVEHYRSGTVGQAQKELANLPTMFKAMFREDWDRSTPEEMAEVTKLYVDAMDLAHIRGPDEIPEPVNSRDIAVADSDETTAKVGITFRTKNSPTRFMLRLEKNDTGEWQIVDGYAVGEDSWVDNMRKAYARMRGNTTPVAFMREVHEAIQNMARSKRAATGGS